MGEGGGYRKIGRSRSLDVRLANLSEQLPFEVELEHAFPCERVGSPPPGAPSIAARQIADPLRYTPSMILRPEDKMRLFSDVQIAVGFERRKDELRRAVDELDAGAVLASNPEELAERVFSGYQITFPRLLRADWSRDPAEEVDLGAPGFAPMAPDPQGDARPRRGSRIRVRVPFNGHPNLFKWRPTTVEPREPPSVHEIREDELLFVYVTTVGDPGPLRADLDCELDSIERYLGLLWSDAANHNMALFETARQAVAARKVRLEGQRLLEEGLGIPLKRRDPPKMHEIPLRRKETPVAGPDERPSGRTADPFMHERHYEHILSVLSSMSVTMERSPLAFRNLCEEDLRWHFVLVLNGHYEGGATGETFNAGGKTDILVGWNDRGVHKNVFVGECKRWTGAQGLSDTIDQLFGYATWRDTKTAILVFSDNKDFSKVLSQIPDVVAGHKSFESKLPYPGAPDPETAFRFGLRHPRDSDHGLTLTVLAFDVPRTGKESDDAGTDT